MATADDQVKLLEAHDDSETEDTVFIESTQETDNSPTPRTKNDYIFCRKIHLSPGISTLIYSLGQGLVEGSYSIPLLLTAGVNIHQTSLIFTLSQLLLTITHVLLSFCPYNLEYRPFILVSSICTCIGLSTVTFTSYLFTSGSDSHHHNIVSTLSILVTGIIIIFVDFNLGLLQLRSRSYLMTRKDAENVSKIAKNGNFTYLFPLGSGMSIIFSLGAINMEFILGRQMTLLRKCQIIFVIVTVLIFLLSLLSLCSSKDKNETNSNKSKGALIAKVQVAPSIFPFSRYLTKDMWLLCGAVFFSGLGSFPLLLFFTTVISESMYNGVLPNGPNDVEAFKVYSQGIRSGCLVLAIGALLLMITSLFLSSVTKRFGLRSVFLIVQYLFVLSLFVFSYWPSQLMTGIVMGSLLLSCYGLYETVPYCIIVLLKENNKMMKGGGQFKEEGSGRTAATIINSMFLLSKLIGSILVWPMSTWLGLGNSVIVISCICSVIGALLSTFIVIPS